MIADALTEDLVRVLRRVTVRGPSDYLAVERAIETLERLDAEIQRLRADNESLQRVVDSLLAGSAG